MKPVTFKVLMVAILAACVSCTNNAQTQVSEKSATQKDSWHILSRSQLAIMSVERALYEKKGSPHFFVRIRIANLSSKTIFVDLNDYWKVIYPNQWGVLLTDHRQDIDERRLEIAALDDKRRSEVLDAFRKKHLTAIPSGASLDYFREFNASGRRDVEKKQNQTKDAKWVFVSMDGQLLLTDGHAVEQLSCSWKDKEASTDVILPFPITWKTIPKMAVVVEEK